jgi:hypothetical protein
MRKKISLRGYTITGAAVLFVGLVGNVQAIPISILKNPIALKSASPKVGTTKIGAIYGVNLDNLNKNLKALPVLLLPVLETALHSSGSYDFSPAKLPNFNHYKNAPPPPTNFTPAPPASALVASVPDGGITVAMLGGVFSALVFLKRKLEA